MNEHDLEITLSKTKKEKPQADQLEFGKVFTDHMFIMDYMQGQGWHNPRIVPYQPITLEPSAMIFHYGQTVFEGLKAYATEKDEVILFRPEKNFERLNRSNARLCIPEIDEDFALTALKKLISVDQDWIPKAEGTSLYIRPFIIATEPRRRGRPCRPRGAFGRHPRRPGPSPRARGDRRDRDRAAGADPAGLARS